MKSVHLQKVELVKIKQPPQNHKLAILANLVNFIVIGIFINKNTYIIPTNAYVTYRSVKDTDNVSRHVFSTESTHVNPRGHLLEVISPL